MWRDCKICVSYIRKEYIKPALQLKIHIVQRFRVQMEARRADTALAGGVNRRKLIDNEQIGPEGRHRRISPVSHNAGKVCASPSGFPAFNFLKDLLDARHRLP